MRCDAVLREEVRVAARRRCPTVTSSPAWRWSGWIRYGCHGSCPSTTSGRASRITAAHRGARLAARCRARRRRSAGTRRRRAPRIAAASRCSSSRVAIERARGRRRRPRCPSSRRCRRTSSRACPRRPTSRASRRSRTRCRRGARRSRARRPGTGRSTVGCVIRRGVRAAARRARRGRRRRRRRSRAPASRTIRTVSERRRASAAWRAARTGPVGERERRRAVGTESTGVPSSRWSGTMTATGAAPSRDDRVERSRPAGGRRARRRTAPAPRSTAHAPARGGRRRRANPGRRRRRTPWSRAHATTSGALETIATGRVRGGVHARIRPSTARAASRSDSESTAASRALPKRERPERDDDPRVVCWDRLGIRCVCYRPWTRCIPPRRRCSGPGCGTACAGRSRATRTSRRTGPVILASNHVSYLDPLTLGVGRRSARRAGSASSPRRSCSSKPALGPLLRAAHQIPVSARHRRFGRRARRPRSTRCARGECVAVFPEGTISDGPRADARQVGDRAPRAGSRRPGRARRAVGHAPHHDQGPQAALAVGRRRRSRSSATPVRIGADEHVQRRDAADDGRDHRVRRAGPRDLSRNRARVRRRRRGGGAIRRRPTAHRRPA